MLECPEHDGKEQAGAADERGEIENPQGMGQLLLHRTFGVIYRDRRPAFQEGATYVDNGPAHFLRAVNRSGMTCSRNFR